MKSSRFPYQPLVSGNTACVCPGRRAHGVRVNEQRGVALFFALIVLVILLIGGVIVVHSINSSLFGAGNLAFRRDLVTQSDAVVAQALRAVATAGSGASDAIANLQHADPRHNYSATVLDVNAQGIPNALLSDDAFSNAGFTGADISVTNAGGSVKTRYTIERMCNQEGAVTASNCVLTLGKSGSSGSDRKDYAPPPAQPGGVIYRLSARVTGPRGTQAFFQTMFSGPN